MAAGESEGDFASREIALCFDKIGRCIGRIVAILDESGEWANVAPPIPGANSLVAIASHVLANVTENLLATVGGEPFVRDREAEFAAGGSSADLLIQWEALRPKLRAVAALIQPSALFETRKHPRRGEISVLEVLFVVLRHVGEHEGHAQLTRDWVALQRERT